MKEYKFRGLDVMTGEWVYGNLVKTGTGSHYIIPQNVIANEIPQYRVDKETVGLYTGLNDKNGKEIFEGDIYDNGWRKYKVEYNEERAGFFPFAKDDGCGCCSDEVVFEPENGEVIGNIFEDPELLEEVKA